MENEIQQTPDFFQFVAWFHENRKRVTTIGVIVLVIGLVVGFYAWHKNFQAASANEALSGVKMPTSIQEATSDSYANSYLRVADDYPGTPAGARALLMAGGIYFQGANFDKAKGAFDR